MNVLLVRLEVGTSDGGCREGKRREKRKNETHPGVRWVKRVSRDEWHLRWDWLGQESGEKEERRERISVR